MRKGRYNFEKDGPLDILFRMIDGDSFYGSTIKQNWSNLKISNRKKTQLKHYILASIEQDREYIKEKGGSDALD